MSKRLDETCWELAAKVLGKPGTIVERARHQNEYFQKGQKYKVVSVDGFILRFENGTGGLADFFRKIEQ